MDKQNDERKQSETKANCVAISPLSDLLADRIDELKNLEIEEKERVKKALAADSPLDAQHHAVMAKVYQAVKRELETLHSLVG